MPIGAVGWSQGEIAMRSDAFGNQIRESRNAGRELALAFGQGVEPRPVNVRHVLQPGEVCFGQVPTVVLQFSSIDAGDIKKGGGYAIGMSPAGLVLGAAYSLARFTTNTVGNQIRKSRAEQEAAGQWRPVDDGLLSITNRRFSVQGRGQWLDVWYEHIRTSDCNGLGISLEVSGSPPLAFELFPADYWYVMFNRLAYQTVVMPPDN